MLTVRLRLDQMHLSFWYVQGWPKPRWLEGSIVGIEMTVCVCTLWLFRANVHRHTSENSSWDVFF